MKLTNKEFANVMEHVDGFGIDGLENLPYENKKELASNEANEYVSSYNTIKECWKSIRENKECFTEENGSVDTGRLYLGYAILIAPREEIAIYWDVRED